MKVRVSIPAPQLKEKVSLCINKGSKLREMNVLRTYAKSKSISALALDFFQRHTLKRSLDFTQSFVNFTIFLARYEQQETGEPGVVRIIYPNDLMEELTENIRSDKKLDQVLNDYFASPNHISSDPDIVRVFEYAALDAAMVKLGLITDLPERRKPYDKEKTLSNEYFLIASENIEEIIGFLQNNFTWGDIFDYHRSKKWQIVKFFLNNEDTMKSTYPGRYTKILKYFFDGFEKKNIIPSGKKRIWIVGAGDGPEVEPLAEILGLENIEDVIVSDIFAPSVPYLHVKDIFDHSNPGEPKRMIMDPCGFLANNGFSPYINRLDIADAETIPDSIENIDISLMFAVLAHLDGTKDKNKISYKQAIKNWISRGREGALFISLMISKSYLPIPGKVLKKIAGPTDVILLKSHPILGTIFNQQLSDGSFLWADNEIESLGVEPVFPDAKEIESLASLQNGTNWLSQFVDNKRRKAML